MRDTVNISITGTSKKIVLVEKVEVSFTIPSDSRSVRETDERANIITHRISRIKIISLLEQVKRELEDLRQHSSLQMLKFDT